MLAFQFSYLIRTITVTVNYHINLLLY